MLLLVSLSEATANESVKLKPLITNNVMQFLNHLRLLHFRKISNLRERDRGFGRKTDMCTRFSRLV